MQSLVDFDFILFGATGDLAMRKIFPSLYKAYENGLLSPKGRIIATSRSKLDSHEFKKAVELKSKIHIKKGNQKKWEEFIQNISYLPIELTQADDFKILQEKISTQSSNIIVYFSISPEFFIQACRNLALVGLSDERVKIVLEKPLGMDLKSCQDINNEIAKYYKEEQVYRIDHYLGKESIQNLLVLRAFNPVFASLWDRKHVKSVEISVFETLGVESRGEFYDATGALRDMVQNHILQILSLVAMDIPQNLDAHSIRKAKLKLLKSLKPLNDEELSHGIIRAQYSKSADFKAYIDEDHVNKQSQTETFVALRVQIANEKWDNVPFYLRTGKRMAESFAQIIVSFKNEHLKEYTNHLAIRLQPDNQLSLNLRIKKTGRAMQTDERMLHFNLDNPFIRIMQPYERLILDVIEGNQTCFNHKEELEAAWGYIDPILHHWQANKSPLFYYPAGSWGPSEAFKLIQKDGNEWHN